LLVPTVYFTAIGITFSAVESLLEEFRGSHTAAKSPWNTAMAGAAAGIVMGGWFTRRFDIACMTGVGLGLLMGGVEVNGPSVICDPETEKMRNFPESVPVQFEETDDLAALKNKYPQFKHN
jgi:hypothetical protein